MRRAARVWALLLGACATAGDRVVDAAGAPVAPDRVAPGHVHVVVVTSHECPIANGYAPTLRELADHWTDLPVHLFLLHVDPDLTPADAAAHAASYGLPGSLLLDPGGRLARRLGATRTPEALVFTATGLAYRGRIDDQWRALGARRPAATRHDLRCAVAVALQGGSVPAPHPPAVGCLLPDPIGP